MTEALTEVSYKAINEQGVSHSTAETKTQVEMGEVVKWNQR